MGKCRTILTLATVPSLLAGQAAPAKTHRHAHQARAASKSGTVKMTIASLQNCVVTSATLNLVDEELLTRTAITAETIDGFAKPVTIASGDPRLAKLNAMVHGIALNEALLPQLEMRTLLRLTCADGKTHVIAGSKTDSKGQMHLNIDGRMAMTDTPLRKALEAMLR